MEEKDRISSVKLANERLASQVEETIKKSKEKKKKSKVKNLKTFKLKTGFRGGEIEVMPNEMPRHCFSIARVFFNNTWQTPLHAWAGVELNSPSSPLYQADQTGSIWETLHPGVQFPKFGPFFISNYGPALPGAPINSNAWENVMSSSPWPASWDNMNTFFNLITTQSGSQMNECEFVTVLEDGPSYILANTIDDSFPAEAITGWCLKYHGEHYPEASGYPINSSGFNACTDVQGYVATHTLLDAGHNISIANVRSDICENPIVRYEPGICGDIGDVNPLTGGILFSIPGTGFNPLGSGWFYEVAPTDVNQVFDTNGNLMPIGPGGTPQTALDNSACSNSDVVKIKAMHSTSQDITTGALGPGGGTLTTIPSQGSQWTNILSFPENMNVYNNSYIIGIGPGSDNPLITSTNYTDWIDVGSEMYHYDKNGNPCYLYNNLVDSISTIPNPPISCQLGAIDTVQAVHYVAIDPVTGKSQYGPNPGFAQVGIATHPFELLCIEGDPTLQTWTFIDSNPNSIYASNGICPGHAIGPGALGPVSNIPVDNCPYCNLPVWKTEFANNLLTSGWSLTGLEWGVNDVNTNPNTMASFGQGYKNTQTINSYTQSTIPPLYHPTLDTRHVAAEEALNYGSVNQHLLEEGEEWFLPSYDEFITMISAVGPNSPLWSAIIPNSAQQDFIDSLNDNTSLSNNSENVYWTSSENDNNSAGGTVGAPLLAANLSSNDYAIAVKTLNIAPFADPLFARRCQALTVRPIRRYKCPDHEEVPEYNFRDSHHIWVPIDRQDETPFVSIYTPGGSGSGRAWNDSGKIPGYHNNMPNHMPAWNPADGLGGVIGLDNYTISFASSDVMVNNQKQFMPSGDGSKAFTSYDLGATNPNGYNTTGFNISIWDNQKNFVGKWHYAKATFKEERKNKLDYHGYLVDCNSITPSLPGTNCYDDGYTDPSGNIIPGNGQNPPYHTLPEEFPSQIAVTMSGVTHLAGPEPIFRYGENHEARDRHMWGHFVGSNEIPYTDWQHPYMENAFNGWTASYAYIKVECAYTQGLGPNAFHSINGDNTDIDSVNVVCMRNLFLDTYQGISPPNPKLLPSTGSLLGVGDESNHNFNDALSAGGGYGWQAQNPLIKGNSTFGDLYHINYRDGRRQELGFWTHNHTSPTHPNLALHPKHWAFIWHAANKPNSGSLNHYSNLHLGYNSCFGYRCGWNIGDIGPAGGIIVAVPGMAADAITPDGVAGMSEDGWYYEMSPIDLGDGSGKDIVFGVHNTWLPYWNDPLANDSASLNLHGGAKNTKFLYDTPYIILGNGFAATSIEQHSFLNMNPPGGPNSPPFNQQNAFILCDQYETYDVHGSIYDDWFLPSIQEMWFACNNLLTTPLSSTGNVFKDLYWTSNEYRDDGPGWPSKTSNATGPVLGNLLPNLTYSTTGMGGFGQLGVNNPALTRSNAAYAVNVNEKITGMGGIFNADLFPTTKAAYVVYKMEDHKVRAMRRFKCPKWVDPGSPGT